MGGDSGRVQLEGWEFLVEAVEGEGPCVGSRALLFCGVSFQARLPTLSRSRDHSGFFLIEMVSPRCCPRWMAEMRRMMCVLVLVFLVGL